MTDFRCDIGDALCFNSEKVLKLRASVPSGRDLDARAAALKAAAHPARLAILHLLSLEECCVCDVAHTLSQPVSTASQHLRKLRDAGLVRSRKKGKWVFYSLARSGVARAVLEQAQKGSAA